MVHAQVDVRFSLVLLSLMIATELYHGLTMFILQVGMMYLHSTCQLYNHPCSKKTRWDILIALYRLPPPNFDLYLLHTFCIGWLGAVQDDIHDVVKSVLYCSATVISPLCTYLHVHVDTLTSRNNLVITRYITIPQKSVCKASRSLHILRPPQLTFWGVTWVIRKYSVLCDATRSTWQTL